ncbi:hypothetical protein BofuT4_uP074220.1 [Botrytis cinerea T4]|uniref:Uncharacterized protein n=1 Tax=Botryotinia fuckeliana (strain T4) TaxID=999810 RepID=G2XP14_BOTF4|nr:hypothetical protein BofuT4_uP074220.1 [Botrytis cinerea T4]
MIRRTKWAIQVVCSISVSVLVQLFGSQLFLSNVSMHLIKYLKLPRDNQDALINVQGAFWPS